MSKINIVGPSFANKTKLCARISQKYGIPVMPDLSEFLEHDDQPDMCKAMMRKLYQEEGRNDQIRKLEGPVVVDNHYFVVLAEIQVAEVEGILTRPEANMLADWFHKCHKEFHQVKTFLVMEDPEILMTRSQVAGVEPPSQSYFNNVCLAWERLAAKYEWEIVPAQNGGLVPVEIDEYIKDLLIEKADPVTETIFPVTQPRAQDDTPSKSRGTFEMRAGG